MCMLEHQRFLVKLRFFVNALILPGGNIAEMFIVPERFALHGLVLDAEMGAAGFITLQRVSRQ